MAVREIVRIDEDKCNGCGQCIVDCPEGALAIVNGKARLVKESYCDGLGACIGACPEDAIIIEKREADGFDEEAVERHMAEVEREQAQRPTVLPMVGGGCPGSALRQMNQPQAADPAAAGGPSQLSNWPVQLTLVPPSAPFLKGADLLLVADCVPFAMADFHQRFLQGRPVVVGCPKLDNPESYVEKLGQIIRQSALASLTILHMEVPCCTGLCRIAELAIESSGESVPVKEVTVSVDGKVLGERDWE